MWIFLWIVASSFILGMFVWSCRILFQQKQAWKAFATKMGLTYQPQKGLLVSPIVTGSLGAYEFSLFSDPQTANDSRGMRYTTVLEFGLRQGLLTLGAVGTQGMVSILEDIPFAPSLAQQDKDWDVSWFVRANNVAVIEKYLTQPRLDMLKKIFRMKILAALFIFDQNNAVLRIETADPLNNMDRIDKVTKGVVALLPVLQISAEERATLEALSRSTPSAPLPPAPVTPPPAAPTTPVAE